MHADEAQQAAAMCTTETRALEDMEKRLETNSSERNTTHLGGATDMPANPGKVEEAEVQQLA